MKDAKENLTVINKEDRFFHLPQNSKNFTDAEMAFLQQIVIYQDDSKWVKGEIRKIVEKHLGNKARILYNIAEMLRINITEGDLCRVKNLKYKPYEEILSDAIYSVDNFKLAEELLKQYEVKVGLINAA